MELSAGVSRISSSAASSARTNALMERRGECCCSSGPSRVRRSSEDGLEERNGDFRAN
uniref:Uncharacterized protein n=1 Tax=Peronospora matthiolae TaxID=2874970 RepID=A0AAV1T5C7_9STRA